MFIHLISFNIIFYLHYKSWQIAYYNIEYQIRNKDKNASSTAIGKVFHNRRKTLWKRCGKPVDNMWKSREFSTAFHRRMEPRKRGGGKLWQLSTFIPHFFPPRKSFQCKNMMVVIPTFHIPTITTSFIYKINSRLSTCGKLFQDSKETWETKQ